jgi:hypothetical protein
MSTRSVGLTSSVVKEEDVICPICLLSAKEPVSPAQDARFFWVFGKLRPKAVCIHTFCRECFLRLEQNRCPICRRVFTKSTLNTAMKDKVDRYVQQTFGINSSEYFREDRLSNPTLHNAKILIAKDKCSDGIELIKELDLADRNAGYQFFVDHCKEAKKLDDLEKVLSTLPDDLRFDVTKFLIEEYSKVRNYNKIVQILTRFPFNLDNLSMELLSEIALYCVDRDGPNKIEDLKIARNIAEKYLVFDAMLTDRVISSVANKFYVLGEKKQAEADFCALTYPDLFCGALFTKLFDDHLDRGNIRQAEMLLKKMGPNWNKEEAGFVSRLAQAKILQKEKFSSCMSKTKVVGLLVLGSITLYFAMSLVNYSCLKSGACN